MNRIHGIDSIRFVCAMTVVLFHLGAVDDDAFGFFPDAINLFLVRLLGVAFNGPAAVIVFFVISGFCIHLPHAQGQSLNLFSFYVRRFLRLAVPALIAAGIWTTTGLLPTKGSGIFWSVICEAIYYFLYPVLLMAGMRLGWWRLVALSYAVATSVALANVDLLPTNNKAYVALGWWTWLTGLPCWLLGCALAENYQRFPKVSALMIWTARAAILFVSVCLMILRFHSNFVFSSDCLSLNVFAFIVFFWLGFEIAYLSAIKLSALMEWAGRWSYSLYLMHVPATTALALTGLDRLGSGYWSANGLSVIAALTVSYCFYLGVEKPAHKLSIFAGRRLSASATSVV